MFNLCTTEPAVSESSSAPWSPIVCFSRQISTFLGLLDHFRDRLLCVCVEYCETNAVFLNDIKYLLLSYLSEPGETDSNSRICGLISEYILDPYKLRLKCIRALLLAFFTKIFLVSRRTRHFPENHKCHTSDGSGRKVRASPTSLGYIIWWPKK